MSQPLPLPVWVALTARALSGGFSAAWPLAIGVALGDLIWPMAAIFGLTWILSVYGDFLNLLRWVAAVVFLVMGVLLIRKPAAKLTADRAMTRPGMWAGFAVGFAFRPLGAIIFGYLGDKLGRKYTFLVTVTLMGVATAGVGFVPSAESIGLWAPAIVLFLRVLQGLALGGGVGSMMVSESSFRAGPNPSFIHI